MSTDIVTYSTRPAGAIMRIFLLEIKFEFIKLFRTRPFTLATI